MLSRDPRGGHRPAQVQSLALALPPTLQPHAIHAMAPATDRRTSAALSGLIYLGLVGGMLVLGRATHVIHGLKPADGPTVIFEHPDLKPPIETKLDPKPLERGGAKGSGTRPADASTYTSAPAQVDDPTPTTLPQADHSGSFDASLPVGLPGQINNGGNPNGAGNTGSSTGAGEGAPITVDFTTLHVLQQVNPVYPPLAKLSRLQGDVVLHMVIDSRGVPTSVNMISGLPQFQAEAVRAAQQWRFTPARVNGEAVEAAFNLTLQFRLR